MDSITKELQNLNKNFNFIDKKVKKFNDEKEKSINNSVKDFYNFLPQTSNVLSSSFSLGITKQKGIEEGKVYSSLKSLSQGKRKGRYAVQNEDGTLDFLTGKELLRNYRDDLKSIDPNITEQRLNNSKFFNKKVNTTLGDSKIGGIDIGTKKIFLTNDLQQGLKENITSTPINVEEVKEPNILIQNPFSVLDIEE